MKRNIAIALAVLSMILVSLVSFNSSAEAQQTRRFTVDTGVVAARSQSAASPYNNWG